MPVPDVSNVVTEDDTPVDNLFSEKQMRLLTESLHSSWHPGFSFVAMANVGLYVALNRPVVVPDVLVTTQVTQHQDLWQKDHRSYFTWVYEGKVPDIVVEIVSNTKGGELTTKKANYEHIGVQWYVVFDPAHRIQEEDLQIFCRVGSHYEKRSSLATDFGLGLQLWTGEFEDVTGPWLRWVDSSGEIVPTGKENAFKQATLARHESERARHESERARHESERANHESNRAGKLANKLRELGIDPDAIG